ncbi:MFS transporter [Sphingobium sp. SCG-1]|uniref:MFS transporter n=1 Tax=Sphingobium sp. SCG-1 TaxID=2072936 RepID=UPI000CD67ABA|nr:MFS transporter [Sphingobium sp. SCG-1]AUW59768.1 MFS transporter [Sphingobium sp. SCG-1]
MAEAEVAQRAMRKTSWRILPLLGLGYLIAYMDRVNISFAALQMNADLGFSATVYGLGGGLFFLSYALFEIPSNIFLTRFGARRWIARIMITWGLVATGMMFVQTPLQFYIMRFLLGMAEAGFLPGVLFYLSSWFPNRYRGRAISRFYVAAPVAGMLMGVFSGGLLSLDGAQGLHGWQWLFLVQGLPAVLIAFLVLRLLPDSPGVATWLSDEERSWIERELAREAEEIGEPARHNIFAALANPTVLRLGFFGMLTVGASIALTLSAPQLLHDETQFDPVLIGWIVSAANTLGAIAMLVCGAWSDRRGERWSIMLGSTAILVLAFLALSLSIGQMPLLVVATYMACKVFLSFVSSSSVMLWSDILHPRVRAVSVAAMNTMSQVGGFAMPFAWGVAKDATGDFRVGLIGLAVVTLVAWLIAYQARSRSRALEASR